MIRMSWCEISKRARRRVQDVLKSGWLSRRRYIPEFEQKVASRHGKEWGIFVSSGTDALRLALLALKEKYSWPEKSRIAVPGLTFAATAAAVVQAGLVPEFTDVDPQGLMNPGIKEWCVGALPVHLFGKIHPHQYHVPFIEDSCEAFGNHPIKGELGCFSFYMSHHVQCGVGGMVVGNGRFEYEVIKSLANHGRVDDGKDWYFGRIGYSSRLTEMEAALGLSHLEDLPEQEAKRKKLAARYAKAFKGSRDIAPLHSEPSTWMFYPIVLNRDSAAIRLLLAQKGIETRSMMPFLRHWAWEGLYQENCPQAEELSSRGILLPLHPGLETKDVDFVAKTLIKLAN